MKDAESFDMKENTFSSCLQADKGGVLRIENSNFTDYGSEFYCKSEL